MNIKKFYYWLVGFRSRPNYWSCTAFTAWLRIKFNVTKKPNAATSQGWCEWTKSNEKNIGYWITEEGLDYLQDFILFIPDVYRHIRIYITNRFIDKPHYINTKLEKGHWYEIETRILNGLFEMLVDFVEVEKAHMQQISDYYKENEEKNPRLRLFHRRVKFNTPSREDGLKYLDWEIQLGEESSIQADTAKIIKELYLWWKDKRTSRIDPMDESGWSAHRDKEEKSGNGIFGCHSDEKTEAEQEETRIIMDKLHELEKAQEQEDTDMMIKLIEIRKQCWT